MSKLQNKYLFFFLFLVFFACTNRPRDVLNVREMTNLLVDLHTLDGVFATFEFHHLNEDERNRYYEAILKKHNINQAQFDSTLVWYSRDPKRFERVYARVFKRLTKQLEDVNAGKFHPIIPAPIMLASAEIWNDTTHFALNNRASERNLLNFTIIDSALMMQDIYILRFDMKVMPEDSCANQRIQFNVHYADGAMDSVYYFVQNDGNLHQYMLRLIAEREAKIDSLTGRFFAVDSCLFAQNAHIENISLMRNYNADIQEEMRTKTEIIEQFRTLEFRLFPMPNERVSRLLIFSQ